MCLHCENDLSRALTARRKTTAGQVGAEEEDPALLFVFAIGGLGFRYHPLGESGCEQIRKEEMTAAHVRRAMRDAGIVSPAVKVELFFKDEEDDFVTLLRMETAWPDCCISDGVLKAWFRCVPEPPPTPPSTPVCACLGPHVDQPPKKKLQALDQDDFQR
jgi:hypothetical protein